MARQVTAWCAVVAGSSPPEIESDLGQALLVRCPGMDVVRTQPITPYLLPVHKSEIDSGRANSRAGWVGGWGGVLVSTRAKHSAAGTDVGLTQSLQWQHSDGT